MGRVVKSLPCQAVGVFSRRHMEIGFLADGHGFSDLEPVGPSSPRGPLGGVPQRHSFQQVLTVRQWSPGGNIPLEDWVTYQVDLENWSSQKSKLGAQASLTDNSLAPSLPPWLPPSLPVSLSLSSSLPPSFISPSLPPCLCSSLPPSLSTSLLPSFRPSLCLSVSLCLFLSLPTPPLLERRKQP